MLHLPELLLGPLSQLDLATPGPLSGAGSRCTSDAVRVFWLEKCVGGGKIPYKYPVSKGIYRWWFHIFLHFHPNPYLGKCFPI